MASVATTANLHKVSQCISFLVQKRKRKHITNGFVLYEDIAIVIDLILNLQRHRLFKHFEPTCYRSNLSISDEVGIKRYLHKDAHPTVDVVGVLEEVEQTFSERTRM